jgi:Emfourin
VRVSVIRGGGFGGLVRTTVADTQHLTPADRDKLAALVRQAGLLDAPASRRLGEPEPDRFTYALTVEDKGQRHEASFSERSLPEPVRNLITWVGTVDGHEESVDMPGGLSP